MKKLLISFVLNHAAKLILVLMIFGIGCTASINKGEIVKTESKEGLLKYKEACVKVTGNPEHCECMINALETIPHPDHVTFTKDAPFFSKDMPAKVKHELTLAAVKCQEQHAK